MSAEYEAVYTMTDYWDGPRRGIASFGGRPHLYESEWDEQLDDYGPHYRLSPISDELFALALEDWAIWLRWERAFHEGRTPRDTHPALPEDRARHDQLEELLKLQLVIDERRCFRARADMRRVAPSVAGEQDGPRVEVAWSPV